MDEAVEKRIKELEEENARLKTIILNLRNKLSAKNHALNRSWQDSYEDVTPDRENR